MTEYNRINQDLPRVDAELFEELEGIIGDEIRSALRRISLEIREASEYVPLYLIYDTSVIARELHKIKNQKHVDKGLRAVWISELEREITRRL